MLLLLRLYGLIRAYCAYARLINAYFAYVMLIFITPLFLGNPVLLAPVILILDSPVFHVIDHAPAPVSVLVQQQNSATFLVLRARFRVGRLQHHKGGFDPFHGDSDLLRDGLGVDIDNAILVAVCQQVSEH